MDRTARNRVKDFRFLNPVLDAVGGRWVDRDSVNGKRLILLMFIWLPLCLLRLEQARVHGMPFVVLVKTLLLAMVITWVICRVCREIRAGTHVRSRLVAGTSPPSTTLRDPGRSVSSIKFDLEHLSKQHALLEARRRV